MLPYSIPKFLRGQNNVYAIMLINTPLTKVQVAELDKAFQNGY